MSTAEPGIGATLAGAGFAPARDRVKLSPKDRARARELDRRILGGQSELDAWAAVVTDEGLGLRDYAGKPSAPVRVVATSLARFYERTASAVMAESRSRVAQRAATYAPRAWDRIEKLVQDQDSAVALQASKFALQTVGVGVKDGSPASAAATFNGPTNVVFSFANGQKARANGSGA